MMNMKKIILMLFMLTICSALSLGVDAVTHTVCASGCDYSTIQSAINAASNGDTIDIQAGTYTENVDVNKRLNITGAGMSSTIVQPVAYWYDVFYVTADNVSISELTATGGKSGIHIYYADDSTINNLNASDNNNRGIYLEHSNSNTLTNNAVDSNSQSGIYLDYSSSNTLTNNTANLNNYYGIYLEDSSSNTLTDNIAKDNNYWDIYLDVSSDVHCNQIIENNTGSGDRPIKYFNSAVDLQDEVLSALIFCNADYSNINNVAIEGSSSKKNNGLFITKTDNSNFTNINSSNNREGIYLISSNSSILTNNTADSNTYHGIYLEHSNSNTLTNNTADSNSQSGIYLSFSSSNTLTNNTADFNNYYGIYVRNSDSNTLTSNNADSNSQSGIYLSLSNSNTLTNNTADSNSQSGIYLSSSSSTTLTDNIAKDNNYWDIYLTSLAGFCNQIMENNTGSGDRPIKYFNDSVNLQDEVLSELILCNADYSNINNVVIEGSSSKKNNGLLIIRTNNSNLTNINSSNNYYGIYLSSSSSNTLTNNTADSNNYYGIYLYYSSSNTLTNNTVNSNSRHGIYLSSSDSNTLTNNTADSNSQSGIYFTSSDSNTLISNNADSNIYGILFNNYCDNNTLTNNTVNSNSRDGISLSLSNSNTLTNNIVDSNIWHGIYLSSSDSNTLTNNIVDSNIWHGIYVRNSDSNTLTNNTADSNSQSGIYLEHSSSNTLTNSTANLNSQSGIYLDDSSNNTLIDNIVKNNTKWDIYLDASSDVYCNHIIENNTGSGDRPIKYFNDSVNLPDEVLSELILCNADYSNINNVTIEGSSSKKNNGLLIIRTDNSNFTNINSSNNYYGIYLYYSSSNTLTNNTADSNNYYGIYLYYSSSNTLINNTAYSNNNNGIYLLFADSNTLTSNNADSNSYGINLYFANSNILTNNTFENNNQQGIKLRSNSNDNIFNNTMACSNYQGGSGYYDIVDEDSNTFYNTICDKITTSGAGICDSPCCRDNDNDGWGGAGSNLSLCPYTGSYDCDDSNETIYPGATDIPGNDIDEDCSGNDSTANFTAELYFEGETESSGQGYYLGDNIGYQINFYWDSVLSDDSITNITVNLTTVYGDVLKSHTLSDLDHPNPGNWTGHFTSDEIGNVASDKINIKAYFYDGAGNLILWQTPENKLFMTGTTPSFSSTSYSYFSDAISNYTVTDLVVNSSLVKVNWSETTLDLHENVIDLDSALTIDDKLVYMNSSLYNELNNSAILTFNNVDCASPYVYYSETANTRAAILAENQQCFSPRCTNIQCNNSILTVTVSSFSGYAAEGNTNLSIDADDPKSIGQEMHFTTEYRNATSGEFISGADCQIYFTDGNDSMVEGNEIYTYNRTFGLGGVQEYNVTCNHTIWNTLTASDNATITSAVIPEFSIITLGLGLIAVLGCLFMIRKRKQ